MAMVHPPLPPSGSGSAPAWPRRCWRPGDRRRRCICCRGSSRCSRPAGTVAAACEAARPPGTKWPAAGRTGAFPRKHRRTRARHTHALTAQRASLREQCPAGWKAGRLQGWQLHTRGQQAKRSSAEPWAARGAGCACGANGREREACRRRDAEGPWLRAPDQLPPPLGHRMLLPRRDAWQVLNRRVPLRTRTAGFSGGTAKLHMWRAARDREAVAAVGRGWM